MEKIRCYVKWLCSISCCLACFVFGEQPSDSSLEQELAHQFGLDEVLPSSSLEKIKNLKELEVSLSDLYPGLEEESIRASQEKASASLGSDCLQKAP